ncbi:hypothetical protein [Hazenella coriacea]|nr:hypothetical protein [Hazenella coriacea]
MSVEAQKMQQHLKKTHQQLEQKHYELRRKLQMCQDPISQERAKQQLMEFERLFAGFCQAAQECIKGFQQQELMAANRGKAVVKIDQKVGVLKAYLGSRSTDRRDQLSQIGVTSKRVNDTPDNFADRQKLEGHFEKHGHEFKGIYKNADEYLDGARDVIKSGIEVEYRYREEIRTGYVRFMGNNRGGKAKFEFVGTNNEGKITTYHTQSGKKFWKTINGKNEPVINPVNQ